MLLDMEEYHCFIVSYDLCQPGRNYDELYAAIKSYYNWGKLTESTWAIVSNMNHVQIRDHLLRYIDPNDRLIVIKGGNSAAWNKLLANNQWLIDNLKL